jgi:hypothetical protein
MKRNLLFAAFAAALVVLSAMPLVPARQPGDEKKPATPISELRIVERVNAATDRALDYLEKKQIKTGAGAGAWNTSNNAINALAVLAFLSRGHVSGRGKYGDTIGEGGAVQPGVLTLAKKFLIASQSKVKGKEGYLAIGGHRMYEHGLTTLALVELYGQDPDPDLESAVRKAVDVILRAQGQTDAGGWDYEPLPTGGSRDLSVSVMQIVALRAASNAEIPVPTVAIERAIRYVRAKANPSGPGYGYASAGPGFYQTRAAGCLSLQLLGQQDDPQIARTLEDMALNTKAKWGSYPSQTYFYYYHYYAIQAFYQHGGKHWNEWHPDIRELLLSKQNKDGSWDVPPGTAEETHSPKNNNIYSTAMATLVLNIYQHFLPAYQR